MNKNRKSWKAICTVIIMIGLEHLFGPGLLYFIKDQGTEIYLAKIASQYPGQILLQWGILSICPAILALTT